jgi:GT2 family glycosyltransferase
MRDIQIIKKSKLFDPVFYLTKYEDIRQADVDPVSHYAQFGWIEGRDPSEYFSTTYYLSNNPDIKEKNVNPLVHFIRSGAREYRNPSEKFNVKSYVENHPEILESNINPLLHFISTPIEIKIETPQQKIQSLSTDLVDIPIDLTFPDVKRCYYEAAPLPCTSEVDIVICVGTNPDNIKECITSIETYTDLEHCNVHLLVDKRNKASVEQYKANYFKIDIYELERFNYSKVNNRVLNKSTNDVVLLNDDTVVTEGWLKKLQTASKGFALTGAHTTPKCSGNPDMWGQGPINQTDYPINMFCAYIPIRLRQVIGNLDEEFVYYGGEDVDYSIRALLNGFPLIVSDAFVIHKDNGSFGESKEPLMRESDKIIYERYKIDTPFNLSTIMPLVSVVMATKNRGYLLENAIVAIQNSLYQNIELVIIDDCSTDDTAQIVMQLQEKYQNIIYLRNYESQGLSRSRKLGVNVAKGQFIYFSDDDDTVLRNRASTPLNWILTHPTLDVVYCDYALTKNGKDILYHSCRPFNFDEYLNLEFNIGSGILLGRTTLFQKIPFHSIYDNACDYDWVFRIIRAGYHIDLCPHIVMIYNRTGESEDHLAGTSKAAGQHAEVRRREKLLLSK